MWQKARQDGSKRPLKLLFIIWHKMSEAENWVKMWNYIYGCSGEIQDRGHISKDINKIWTTAKHTLIWIRGRISLATLEIYQIFLFIFPCHAIIHDINIMCVLIHTFLLFFKSNVKEMQSFFFDKDKEFWKIFIFRKIFDALFAWFIFCY